MFLTFLISVPAMVMPMTRGWLKLHGYMVVVCGFFTMIVGLSIWFETLKTRSNLSAVWNSQPASTQSLLQQKVGHDHLCGVRLLILYSSPAAATITAPHQPS